MEDFSPGTSFVLIHVNVCDVFMVRTRSSP